MSSVLYLLNKVITIDEHILIMYILNFKYNNIIPKLYLNNLL